MGNDIIPSAEYSPLAPEDSEIANTYLETMDLQETATRLGIPIHRVSEYISKPVVAKYINEVFMNTGYRNRFKLGALLDKIIEKKLEEMEESMLGSNKDILDIIEVIAKMRKDERDHERKLEEIRSGTGKRQTNIQINNTPPNPYGDFTSKLLDLDDLK